MSDKIETIDTKHFQDYVESIRSRRTINIFKQGRVPDELVLKAIETARWAPNHRKTEPWHFYLLGPHGQARVKSLITEIKSAGQDASTREATTARLNAIPGWLVLACDISGDPITQLEDQAACACAAQNMMLVLWQAGVGTKWTTGKVIRDPRFFDIVGMDMHRQTVIGLFWYGYPQHIPGQTRKPVENIVVRLD